MDHFYFAIPNGMPTSERAEVPARIAARYGIKGAIRFVGQRNFGRLYVIDHEAAK